MASFADGMKGITSKRLREILRYEPDTGHLYWRERLPSDFSNNLKYPAVRCCNQWNMKHAGKLAGSKNTHTQYVEIMVLGVAYLAHRIIWMMQTGAWPDPQIDHKNHIRDDNRLLNLSESTQQQNCKNHPMYKNNTSGVCGVYWEKRREKWMATIMINRKGMHLGYFSVFDDAVVARKAANVRYGFHENHGAL